MTEPEALRVLEGMGEFEFQGFYRRLPPRTRLCLEGGLVDWREVLPGWYIKFQKEATP